jgi:hypothetical protein
MACNQGEHARQHTDVAAATAPVATGLITDNSTRLIVSNAPETIGSQIASYPATLYACTIPCAPEARLRILLSHINQSDGKLYFGVRARASAFATVADCGIQRKTGTDEGDLRIAGMCIASAHLYRTLDGYSPPSSQLGLTESTLWQYGIDSGKWNSICLVLEMTVKPLDIFGQVDFRVVATKDPSDWGFPTDPVVGPADPSGHVHIRGWWPYSDIQLGQTISTIDGCADQIEQFAVGAGDDIYAYRNLDPIHGTLSGNNGLYGVNASYIFTVQNKCLDDRVVRCYLRARNVGVEGKFWGAARVENFSQLKVDKIEHNLLPNEPPPVINLCSLNDGGGPIVVPGKTLLPIDKVLQFATGISAEMPVNFLAATVSV